ncbi:MAG: Hsp20/alpha crystallin family protein [Acidobacteria bacterium]|nr:MAG: Hsp20/alpha crystallin family protein [Acidobacteriota bacterium]
MADFGPYLEFVRIQTEMNKLFESLQELRDPATGSGADQGGWLPNVDVCESAEDLLVEAEMPGVDPASLSVCAGNGNLILSGNKPRSEEPSSATSHRRDRVFGKFRRVIPLAAAINTHKAEARLKGGVLSVRFPKVPNKRGEEVNIAVQNVEE